MAAAEHSAGPVTGEEFSQILSAKFAGILEDARGVAAGISGGPDSMALAWLLMGWAQKNKRDLHLLTVDHGLRAGSAAEARQVAAWAKARSVKHKILRRRGKKPETRIQEEARRARYGLMAGYCAAENLQHLFLAHHMDDQAETFLIRLAAGSGLDGLSAMKPVQPWSADLVLMRPLLEIPKTRLLATCRKNKIPFVQDPGNESGNFARVRLRKSWGVLEKEGLSAKRLALTASRLERARAALEEMADKACETAFVRGDKKSIVLRSAAILEAPQEIGFRVLVRAVRKLRPGAAYSPRTEKLEALFSDLADRGKSFRKRTLGGVVFERNDKKAEIRLSGENKGKPGP